METARAVASTPVARGRRAAEVAGRRGGAPGAAAWPSACAGVAAAGGLLGVSLAAMPLLPAPPHSSLLLESRPSSRACGSGGGECANTGGTDNCGERARVGRGRSTHADDADSGASPSLCAPASSVPASTLAAAVPPRLPRAALCARSAGPRLRAAAVAVATAAAAAATAAGVAAPASGNDAVEAARAVCAPAMELVKPLAQARRSRAFGQNRRREEGRRAHAPKRSDAVVGSVPRAELARCSKEALLLPRSPPPSPSCSSPWSGRGAPLEASSLLAGGGLAEVGGCTCSIWPWVHAGIASVRVSCLFLCAQLTHTDK